MKQGVPNDIYEKHRDAYNCMSVDDVVKEEISSLEELLSLHRELIIENLNKYKENPSIQNKYFWCKDFHNNFCRKYDYKNFII